MRQPAPPAPEPAPVAAGAAPSGAGHHAAIPRSTATFAPWPRWQRAGPGSRAVAGCAALVAIEAALAAMHWLSRDLGLAQGSWLRGLFTMGGEFRLPALFSTAQLWLAAALALSCWRLEGRGVWLAAAVLCAYLGGDELLSVHERVGRALRDSGWLTVGPRGTVAVGPLQVYTWVLVFAPITLVVGLALLRGFLQVLAPPAVAALAVGTLVFLGGAIGFETRQSHGLARGWHARDSDQTTLNVMLEESLEMLGVTIVVTVFALRRGQLRQRLVVAAGRCERA